VCTECLDSIPVTEPPHLPYGWRIKEDSPVRSVCSYWDFQEQIQTLIHALKYRRKPSLGEFLGRYIASEVTVSWIRSVDIIIPVPLHKTKQRARGFNQTAAIAKGLSQELHLPVCDTALVREKYTQTQTRLSRSERRYNLIDAFRVSSGFRPSKNENILLVDDVFTTGATLESAARSLRKKCESAVYGLTLATAPLET